MSAAAALRPGLDALATAELAKEDAYILVAGFFAEATLKALVAHKRWLEGNRSLKPIRNHNLVKLCEEAILHSGNVLKVIPPWAPLLNAFHDSPYFIRYKESGGLYALPPRSTLHRELVEVSELTKGALMHAEVVR